MRKYCILPETKTPMKVRGVTHYMYKIQALRSFDNVNDGDIGGWIEGYDNLSQDGRCWIFEHCAVFGENTVVFGDALVKDYSVVFDGSLISGNVTIYHNSYIFGRSILEGYTTVSDSKIYGNSAIQSDKISLCITDSIINKSSIYNTGGISILSSSLSNMAIQSGDLRIYTSNLSNYAIGDEIKNIDHCIVNKSYLSKTEKG